RFGHSMVRDKYEWNYYHSSKESGGLGGRPALSELFNATKFAGTLGSIPTEPNLLSEWVIDWRRFYRFDGLPYEKKTLNFGRPINTVFDLHLETIAGYPHDDLPDSKRSITVRNLL